MSQLVVVPPLPEGLESANSMEEVLSLLDDWVRQTPRDLPPHLRRASLMIVNQMKAVYSKMFALQNLVSEGEEKLDTIAQRLLCHKCQRVCRDPYVLFCNHIFCGKCLQDAFRPQLQAKLNATVEFNRVSLGKLCDILSANSDKRGFSLSVSLLDHLNLVRRDKLISYVTPCCAGTVTERPLRVLALSDLCNDITSHRACAHYFDGLFPE